MEFITTSSLNDVYLPPQQSNLFLVFILLLFSPSLFVVGGNDGSGYLDTCERYDLRTGKWEEIASLPHAFGANGLAIWDDKVVAVGKFAEPLSFGTLGVQPG